MINGDHRPIYCWAIHKTSCLCFHFGILRFVLLYIEKDKQNWFCRWFCQYFKKKSFFLWLNNESMSIVNCDWTKRNAKTNTFFFKMLTKQFLFACYFCISIEFSLFCSFSFVVQFCIVFVSRIREFAKGIIENILSTLAVFLLNVQCIHINSYGYLFETDTHSTKRHILYWNKK